MQEKLEKLISLEKYFNFWSKIVGAVADDEGNLVEIEVPYKKCQKKICPKLLFETLNDAIYFCYDKVIKIQEIVQIPPYLKPEIAALLRLGLNLTKWKKIQLKSSQVHLLVHMIQCAIYPM